MAFTIDPAKFRFASDLAAGVKGKRVLISGAGKDGGLGQAFALAAGLNGAASVGVHFHSSYDDALDLVDFLNSEGVNAFPLQADVTNLGDLWATRALRGRTHGWRAQPRHLQLRAFGEGLHVRSLAARGRRRIESDAARARSAGVHEQP